MSRRWREGRWWPTLESASRSSRHAPTGSCAAAQHPTLGRGYLECADAPIVELLALLTANGFTNYVVSGGGRDFMRPISQELYGIPREQVIGSATALAYTSDERGGTITHTPAPDYLNDGPEKPIRIWSRTGRRPLLAAGNSNGDIAMLDFTRHDDKPFLRLLVLHDDAEREFDYTRRAEQALETSRPGRLDDRQRPGRLGHRLLTRRTADVHPSARPVRATRDCCHGRQACVRLPIGVALASHTSSPVPSRKAPAPE